MAKNHTCDNWLAKLLACANLMISDKSLHISTLKNVMCDILQAKMYSVMFCQQTKKVCIVECQNFHVSMFYLFPRKTKSWHFGGTF